MLGKWLICFLGVNIILGIFMLIVCVRCIVEYLFLGIFLCIVDGIFII